MKKILISLLVITSLSATAQPLSRQMAATVMNIWKDSIPVGSQTKWSYDMGVVLKGFEGIWMNTGDVKYFNAIQAKMDWFVQNDGTVKGYELDEYNIDHVNNGKLVLLLYRITGKEKYKKAADLLRSQLKTHPRTNEGGFWHKKVYPYQMWLDGLYMGAPFYAEYAMLFHEDTAFNDIANQFIWMEKHARDVKTGLLHHAWDESKQQQWADKKTGKSPHFWGRAMGWYSDAIVDALDYFPANHPKRKALIDILNRLVVALEKQQDKTTGLWYDVMNYNGPGKEKNYFEASASCQFVYAIAKGVRKGYLPAAKIAIAKKAYDGIVKQFIKVENGQTNLYGTVKVSGLGGKPYRDGSFEYYMSEQVIVNDPKGVGAFLLASNEMELLPTLSNGKGKTVLLDRFFNSEKRKDATGADVYWHYVWNERSHPGFYTFGHIFEKNGAKLASLDVAPTAANLKGASVYIIVDPDHKKDNPSPNYVNTKDITAIKNWVKAGGTLLLMANDSNNCELKNFNMLAGEFGIRFTDKSINMVKNDTYEQGAVNPGKENTIFPSPAKMFLKEISTLELKMPAQPYVYKDEDIVIAVRKFGNGKVLAVGDPWLYNEYVDGRKLPAEYENYKAAEDLVKWLLATPAKNGSK
ncbi:MAG TPA: glycoside hydrolase family 88 protein [Chitinophagaceae bacterium]|jgi:unsaturated rhamnogalacturonyl hydrolase|nr:glycoside hydrolase family 88 protein [Chitinophagaceae bacterium]HMU57186.1 glycoside hydrolase family 88 protein [Chitinophagaceae bacterium]